MTESNRSCELSLLVAAEGLCFPADSSLQAGTLESALALVVYHVLLLVRAEIGHLHKQGTARLPPGWQSLRWHVWGPGAWRWPGAVCSRHSAACCPSRWAPRSHFLRSWLEVGSQVRHSTSWLSPLLTKKWIQHHPINIWEHVLCESWSPEDWASMILKLKNGSVIICLCWAKMTNSLSHHSFLNVQIWCFSLSHVITNWVCGGFGLLLEQNTQKKTSPWASGICNLHFFWHFRGLSRNQSADELIMRWIISCGPKLNNIQTLAPAMWRRVNTPKHNILTFIIWSTSSNWWNVWGVTRIAKALIKVFILLF